VPVIAPAGSEILRSCSRTTLVTDQLGALDRGLLSMPVGKAESTRQQAQCKSLQIL